MRIPVIIFFVICCCASQMAFSQDLQKTIEYGSNKETGKYITINKVQIYYETYGQGVPLLLLHGGLGSIGNFKECIPQLAKHFLVIAPDSPGHGRSSQTDSLSYPYLANCISEFINKLKLDSLYVMGWSDGGIIGLILAADRPDKVKKLIAVGANTRADDAGADGVEWIKNSMVNWAKNNKEWITNYLKLTPQPEKLTNYLINTRNMWLTEIYIPQTKVELIKIPTLILQGDRDGIQLEHTVELHRLIKQSQLCIMPNTSHFVFEERPEWMNDIALEFFNATK